MTDFAYFTVDQIREVADHVIAELKDDPDGVMTIPLPNGLTPRERRDLIDHHHAVIREVKRRGWSSAKAIVRHTPDGSVLAIDLCPPDAA
jgi:hypothetical protein